VGCTRVAIFIGSGTTVSFVGLGIYADSGNAASTLLANATVTTIAKGDWNIVTLPPVSIVAGTKYWIGIDPMGPGSVLEIQDTASGQTVYGYAEANVSALPTNWSNGTSFPYGPVSVYVAEPNARLRAPVAAGPGGRLPAPAWRGRGSPVIVARVAVERGVRPATDAP
jgi:hypothetical protein